MIRRQSTVNATAASRAKGAEFLAKRQLANANRQQQRHIETLLDNSHFEVSREVIQCIKENRTWQRYLKGADCELRDLLSFINGHPDIVTVNSSCAGHVKICPLGGVLLDQSVDDRMENQYGEDYRLLRGESSIYCTFFCFMLLFHCFVLGTNSTAPSIQFVCTKELQNFVQRLAYSQYGIRHHASKRLFNKEDFQTPQYDDEVNDGIRQNNGSLNWMLDGLDTFVFAFHDDEQFTPRNRKDEFKVPKDEFRQFWKCFLDNFTLTAGNILRPFVFNTNQHGRLQCDQCRDHVTAKGLRSRHDVLLERERKERESLKTHLNSRRNQVSPMERWNPENEGAYGIDPILHPHISKTELFQDQYEKQMQSWTDFNSTYNETLQLLRDKTQQSLPLKAKLQIARESAKSACTVWWHRQKADRIAVMILGLAYMCVVLRSILKSFFE